MEQLVVGVLYTHGPTDAKVRRWTLNAIARVGHPASSVAAVTHALQAYQDDPQTAASAVAAMFALCPADAYERVKAAYAFPEDLIVLSALQYAPQSSVDMMKATVNINTATIDVLKLALVAIGLNRAPEHIFDPKFANSVIVRDLGTHDDDIVSQYSVWAICENPTLGMKDLGIPLKEIEAKPPNVRAWMFRLIAANDADPVSSLEYIELGSHDTAVEVRSGLAQGLEHVFFDGIQPIVLDWYNDEQDEDVRLRLLDHIVRQADHSPSYKEEALQVFKAASTSTRQRQRMDAAAAGQPLYSEFRQYDYSGGATLFDPPAKKGSVTIVNKLVIQGNVTNSAISQTGDATATTSHSPFSIETRQAIQEALADAQRELHLVEIDTALMREMLALLQKAATNPTPETLTPALSGLKKVASVISSSGKIAAGIGTAVEALEKLGVFC
jgi:hypothetical protein